MAMLKIIMALLGSMVVGLLRNMHYIIAQIIVVVKSKMKFFLRKAGCIFFIKNLLTKYELLC